MLTLELLYYPASADQRSPIRVASIMNRRLLLQAARLAIEEAESSAEELSDIDHGLAAMQIAEIGRLRKVLTLFTAELQPEPVDSSVM